MSLESHCGGDATRVCRWRGLEGSASTICPDSPAPAWMFPLRSKRLDCFGEQHLWRRAPGGRSLGTQRLLSLSLSCKLWKNPGVHCSHAGFPCAFPVWDTSSTTTDYTGEASHSLSPGTCSVDESTRISHALGSECRSISHRASGRRPEREPGFPSAPPESQIGPAGTMYRSSYFTFIYFTAQKLKFQIT